MTFEKSLRLASIAGALALAHAAVGAQPILKIGYTPTQTSHYGVGSTVLCDEIEKENFVEFFKEKAVYPRDNIFILIDKIRLGFRFEMIKDPDGYTDTSYLSFQFPCSFYCLLIDGKKVWFHEDNIEKIG